MDFSTKYLGLELKNPIVVGSSSLTHTPKNIKKCEESGAGAVVLKSLYEEQITADLNRLSKQEDMYIWYPEAVEYINAISTEGGVHDYLEVIKQAKELVDIPLIASINCVNDKGWVSFSKELENAGADAIELNIAVFPESNSITGQEIEKRHINIVKAVTSTIKIPVAVKLSPYFSNLRWITNELHKAGAKGIVLFNRFYRPDIDIYELRMTSPETLSGAEEITMPMRWIGLLSRELAIDIGASTGIHNAEGVIKMLLSGADTTQLCSVLYRKGMGQIHHILDELRVWMFKMNFNKISDFKGLINKDPLNTATWERIHFMKKSSGKLVKPIYSSD